jgi:2,3-dihydroxybenzoate-AMP ligase
VTAVLDHVRVPADRADHYRRQGWWQPVRLTDVVLGGANEYPARCALVSGDRRFTYGELASAVNAAAVRMARLGITRNDTVVVQLPNDIEFVVVLLALLRIGAVAVLVPSALREYELYRIMDRTNPVALAMPVSGKRFDHLTMARSLKSRFECVRWLLIAGGTAPDIVSLDDLCAPAELPPYPKVGDARDPAVLLLSSGSTGPPKLMVRTHEDYGYVILTTRDIARVGPDAVYLAVLPASHTFGLAYPGVLGTLAAGGRVVFGTPEDPAATVRSLERERVTHTAAVPALVTQWLAAAEATGFRGDLSVLQVGGAPFTATGARAAMTTFGCTVQQVYGMSEGLTNYTRLDDPEHVILETQGRPASPGDELRIVDDAGHDVPDGATGELLTRGPFTIAGYFRDEVATDRAFTPDGFYRTGDLVRRQADGNLVVVGRTKNVINRGGEKICAEDLEQAVLRDPSVRAAVAVAADHPVLGETVCLFVVPASGAEVSLFSIRRFLKDSGVAGYKMPERLEILRDLPLIGIGKVDRTALRARARKLST